MRRSRLLFWLFTIFCLAGIWTLTVQPWRHTLEANGRWESGKLELEYGVLGGLADFITPLALHGNRLNLGAWHGFQEFRLKNPGPVSGGSFSAEIPAGSYLYIFYGMEPSGRVGLRLSRHPSFPSLWVRMDPRGKFLEKSPLQFPPHLRGENQIQLKQQGSGFSFHLNGKKLGTYPWKEGMEFGLAFRGGSSPVWIDNVQILDKEGNGTFFEEFNPKRGGLYLFLGLFFIILGLEWLILVRKGRGSFAVGLNVSFLLLALPLYFFNGHFLIPNYWANRIYFKAKVLLENYRPNYLLGEEAVSALRNEYTPLLKKEKRKPRLLLLGSSQTWGAGARNAQEKLGHQLGTGLGHQVVNTSISGGRARELINQYLEEWIGWEPDLVLLNLAHNDKNPRSYRRALKDLARTNVERGIPTVFVLEPNAPELIRDNLLGNHAILREVAQAYHIPVLDLHACLRDDKDTGILWWDFVHLTSYGQERAAHCLTELLRPVLGTEKNASI